MFEIDSLDYRGTHKKHSKKPIGADYLRCTFSAGPEPDCLGYTALGSSLLRFHGFDLIGAIGRWKDAQGPQQQGGPRRLGLRHQARPPLTYPPGRWP